MSRRREYYRKWKAAGLCVSCGGRPRGKTLTCAECHESDQIKDYRRGRTPERRWARAAGDAKRRGYAPPNREQFLDAWAVRLAREWEGGMHCAVCGTRNPGPKDWCLDHDHKTGAVREWLCKPCNIAEGEIRTSVNARKLTAYMEKYEKGN